MKIVFTLLMLITIPILCTGSGIFADKSEAANLEYIPEEKIVMTWDYITRKKDNDKLIEKKVYESLDVISPTWFSITNSRGNVECIADKGYVNRAHENNVEVWALFDNSFDDKLTYQVLSNRNKRARIIAQITEYAIEYSIDGINIDFEAMSKKTGVYFEKFIVELYATLKPLNICLSVDISSAWKTYDISLISDNTDYIILMAYDQHHEYSETIGAVASIGWVKQCIEDLWEYVPSKKIILGVPFYTRIWTKTIKNGETIITSESDGMQSAYDRFAEVASIWNREEETEQIYAEYKDGLNIINVWLEDEHSLSLKLDTVNDYGLAGVAGWRLGLEWPETWDMMNAYFR